MHTVSFESQLSRPVSGCDLAVLVPVFPKLSETFVLGDLLALEDAGVRLRVFSVRLPEAGLVHSAVQRLRADVEYLPEISGRRPSLVLRATQAALLVRDPRHYARGLAEIYASADYSRLRLQQALLLARRLDRLGCPPLYIHFAHKPATIGRFASLLLGTPFAISAHAVDVWTPPIKELRAKFRDARLVLCCYREAQDHVRRLVDGHTPVELAHHGVDVPLTPRREELSPPVLLSVGRLMEKKGFDTFLRAAALVRDRGLDFRVRIVGDGPLWATLQRLVNELELGEIVRFMGPLTQEELVDQYSQATMFVLASQIAADGNRDGMPNTLLEAMAHRLPVVSSTLPSIAEAIGEGEHGLLVAPRDPVALAGALVRLLEDDSLRERLAGAARARVIDRYDRAALAPRVREALTSAGLLGDRGR
mgnify:CR=1 FL=1